jgi:hypothetical protein
MARSPGQDRDKTNRPASKAASRAGAPEAGAPEARAPEAGAPKAGAADISSDLSFDEQVEIIGQINRVVARNKIQISDDTFTFDAKKHGGLVPLLINLCALAVVVSAGIILVRFFNRQEVTLVTETARVLTAETKLIEAFRQESEARLSEKDREIASIRERLAELDAERRKLQLDSETLVRRRETQLLAELEGELEAMRRKLEQEGVSAAGIQQQLNDLETGLREENRAEITALQERSDQELAAKDAELSKLQEQLRQRENELQDRFQQETERLEAERLRADAQLSQLREIRQQEDLVFDQLLARYARLEAALQEGSTATALRDLENLEAFLATPAIAALPAVRQRLPLDRFTITSARALITARQNALREAPGEELLSEIAATVAAADQAARSADNAGALRLYAEALAAIPDLQRSHEALLADSASAAAAAERNLGAARAEVQQLSRELRGARAAAEARRTLVDRLSSFRRRYGGISSSSVSERVSAEQVLALVETKLRVREAMTSEPMNSRYPDLYAELEEYLDAFAAEQQARARDTALEDVIAVLDALAARRESLPGLQGGYSTPRQDLFAELLEKLALLLE